MRANVRAMVVGVVLAAGLVACSSTRPLPLVKREAEHALSFRNYDKAAADFGEYLNRKPDANDVRVNLGKAQLGLGNARDAAANFATALDVDPQNDEILELYTRALWEAGEKEQLQAFLARAASERGRASDYLRIADYSQRLGLPDESLTALITAAKIDGGRSVDVQLAIADFYKGVGKRSEMVKRLRMAYFLQPENPEVLARIREAGEISGPTFAIAPSEFVESLPASLRQPSTVIGAPR
jgi:tetratricopeptide (TPR) repeat protein